MTAHAPAPVQLRHTRCRVKFYCLMTAVHAGDIAPSTADAASLVKHREYYASSEGKITYSKPDHQLMVTPIYIIDGNVDNATGDIRFNGDVLVKGNVFANTTIRATGNITVEGHVEIATLHAGKNVILKN